ncbi:RluA family pseudouridine synthase [Virgibacillus sp. YIM 98842]|uniref:RluA family pseudouridine synthase n=1 Tax=Virgibacillus sp. YIM 98842 TaxID=2663533 RepID=UPI0013D9825E|nr:RluA family pseudouridine synthase [Virgibacillus sp. YIM 98842]
MSVFHHKVTKELENIRLDKLLADINEGYSRSQVQDWIAKGIVTVNSVTVKANYKCQPDDLIEWRIPEIQPVKIEPENMELSIVFEDNDLLVVNKEKGMVVHPSAGHESGTLVNVLLYHVDQLSTLNGVERPGIVHRLDKDTSGLLVIAKNNNTHQDLADQLAERKIIRKYEAIVHGRIPHEKGVIDAPIGRDPKDRQKMAVTDNGKPAVTHFRVIQSYPGYTHAECQLETGRTHQIRVHMKYIGYPVVGDPKYGPRKTMDAGGQVLHAKTIGFTHPKTKKWMEFTEAAPDTFYDILAYIHKMY